MRGEIREIAGRNVLVDCYNANPASMEAALQTVTELRGKGEAFAILGDMLTSLDLVLSDVMLADGTGPELVEELLQHRPGLPVLYMTGFASADALNSRVLSADAVSYTHLTLPTIYSV